MKEPWELDNNSTNTVREEQKIIWFLFENKEIRHLPTQDGWIIEHTMLKRTEPTDREKNVLNKKEIYS